MLDTRKKKFRVQGMPFKLETTIVILLTLSIDSCVNNVALENTSEKHRTNYDLDLVIKRTSEPTAEVFRWLCISTNPTLRLEI